MNKAIYTHAWDFLDEGVDTILEQIREIGCREVIVAMAYHAGRFLLPHNPKHRIYYPEDGVVYFKADKVRYAGQRLKPVTASMLSGRNLMGEIIEKSEKRGMSVTAWFVCLHNSRLGFQHPDIVMRNAFGDPYYHYLCPMNPDASGYVLNLLDDFALHYAGNGILLESLSYSGFEHGYHHEFYSMTINAELSALLGLCFCETCRRAAKKRGIDVERLAKAVRKRIDTCVGSNSNKRIVKPFGTVESIGNLRGIKDYLRMRCERVERLLGEAAGLTRMRKMRLDFFGPVFAPVNMSVLEGIDLAGLDKNIDRYVLRIEEKEPAMVEKEIRYAKRYFKPDKIVLSLRLFDLATPSQRNLKAKVELAKRHGLAGCNFYNYGMVSLSRLNWLTDI
ncbi:MAG: family 10 glycosylhydrolase [Kiritimatiellae bacterium]|nr:family 10 glycosylhydrolase [Kiritimatiellia bacterium]